MSKEEWALVKSIVQWQQSITATVTSLAQIILSLETRIRELEKVGRGPERPTPPTFIHQCELGHQITNEDRDQDLCSHLGYYSECGATITNTYQLIEPRHD